MGVRWPLTGRRRNERRGGRVSVLAEGERGSWWTTAGERASVCAEYTTCTAGSACLHTLILKSRAPFKVDKIVIYRCTGYKKNKKALI